jgi:hypothetical protein
VAQPAPSARGTAPTVPTAEQEARYKALVQQVRDKLFHAGAVVPGWDYGGANPDAELRAAGADRFYYQMDKKGGRHELAILTDRPIAAVAPPDWRPLGEYGSAEAPAEHAIIQFAPIDAWHVLAMRAGSWHQKDVDCTRGVTHAVLFEKPGIPADAPDPERAGFIAKVTLDAAEGQTVCSRYEGDRAHGWEVRHFLPDGREIVEEQRSRMRIVPAGPIDRLIAMGR